MKNGKRTNDKIHMLTLRINDIDAGMIDTVAREIGITRSSVVRTVIHDNLSSYLRLQTLQLENEGGDMV